MQKSKRLKILALCWLRYDKQMPLVATEAGYWNGDVMGIDEDTCIEIEVKVSKQDLLRDLESKRDKHYMYQNPELTKWTPNLVLFPRSQGARGRGHQAMRGEGSPVWCPCR